jgi:hypothetical protein
MRSPRTRLTRCAAAGPEPAIVLLHSWPDPAPDALAEVLDRLRAANVEFVTVAELG